MAAVSVTKLFLLSETELLHLHLDAVKSDQSSGSEKEKIEVGGGRVGKPQAKRILS